MPPREDTQDSPEPGSAVTSPGAQGPDRGVAGSRPRIAPSARRPLPAPRPALSPQGWGPPPPSLGPTLFKYWWLVLIPALLLMGAGIYVGYQRDPEYSVESRYEVGSISIRNQAVPGFGSGTESLASAYARIVDTSRLTTPIARRLDLPPATVAERVTADPVPESPVLRVVATGPSARDALALAEAASAELRAFIRREERESVQSDDLLAQFRRATRQVDQLERRRGVQRGAVAGGSTPTRRRRLEATESALSAKRLEAEAIGIRYREAAVRDEDAAAIDLLEQGREASSDRGTFVQRLGFVGFLAGSVIGGALALLFARWRGRRLAKA